MLYGSIGQILVTRSCSSSWMCNLAGTNGTGRMGSMERLSQRFLDGDVWVVIPHQECC